MKDFSHRNAKFKNTLSSINSKYQFIYSPWKSPYGKYNKEVPKDKENIYKPLNHPPSSSSKSPKLFRRINISPSQLIFFMKLSGA